MGILWIKFSKKLDFVTDKLVELYAKFRDFFAPGWIDKNQSRIDELKLMLRAFNRSPLGVFGFLLIAFFFILGIFGPAIAPEPYWELFRYPRNMPPGWEGHIFGTDHYGRDLLSIMLWGARVSLVIGLLVVALGVPLGILLGLIAAYYGGIIDEVIMRIVDIFYAFPALMLAIAMAAVLPSTISNMLFQIPILEGFFTTLFGIRLYDSGNLGPMLAVILAMVIVWWPGYTRMIRAVALSEKEKVYVEASILGPSKTEREADETMALIADALFRSLTKGKLFYACRIHKYLSRPHLRDIIQKIREAIDTALAEGIAEVVEPGAIEVCIAREDYKRHIEDWCKKHKLRVGEIIGPRIDVNEIYRLARKIEKEQEQLDRNSLNILILEMPLLLLRLKNIRQAINILEEYVYKHEHILFCIIRSQYIGSSQGRSLVHNQHIFVERELSSGFVETMLILANRYVKDGKISPSTFMKLQQALLARI